MAKQIRETDELDNHINAKRSKHNLSDAFVEDLARVKF